MIAQKLRKRQCLSITTGFIHKEVRGGINHAHFIKDVMEIQISSQPTYLEELVYGQANINDTIQKKLTANDKSLEIIHAKLDGFSTIIKNQLSVNKILKTQLAHWQLPYPLLWRMSMQ